MVACALLSQSVGLADGGVKWSGARRRVPPRPAKPGPATRGSPGRRGPTGSCAGRCPGWMALDRPPRVQAVPHGRNTSASSMHRPQARKRPASASCPQCSPVPALRRGQGDGLPAGRGPRQGGRKEQPGIGHQAAVVEGDWIRSGWLRGSIYWVLLGVVFLLQNHYQIQRSTFLPLQDANPTPSFGGFGLRHAEETSALLLHLDCTPPGPVSTPSCSNSSSTLALGSLRDLNVPPPVVVTSSLSPWTSILDN